MNDWTCSSLRATNIKTTRRVWNENLFTVLLRIKNVQERIITEHLKRKQDGEYDTGEYFADSHLHTFLYSQRPQSTLYISSSIYRLKNKTCQVTKQNVNVSSKG